MSELQKAYKEMSPMEQVRFELKTLDAIVAIRWCSAAEAALLLYGKPEESIPPSSPSYFHS